MDKMYLVHPFIESTNKHPPRYLYEIDPILKPEQINDISYSRLLTLNEWRTTNHELNHLSYNLLRDSYTLYLREDRLGRIGRFVGKFELDYGKYCSADTVLGSRNIAFVGTGTPIDYAERYPKTADDSINPILLLCTL